MDNFSKFTDDELEVIDELSITDESIIEMTKYHKSFMDGLRMCGKIFSIIP